MSMEPVFVSGKELMHAGYNLKDIAARLSKKSSEFVMHPSTGMPVFSHNELEREEIYEPSSSFDFPVDRKQFFFIAKPEIFEYFRIKINDIEIESGKSQLSRKENIQKLTSSRRKIAHANRKGVISLARMEKDNVLFSNKMLRQYAYEQSHEDLFFFDDQHHNENLFPLISFTVRDFVDPKRLEKGYVLEFKICVLEEIKEWLFIINKHKEFLANTSSFLKGNSLIAEKIWSQARIIRSEITFSSNKQKHYAIAKNDEFENYFTKKGTDFPFLLTQNSKFYKVYKRDFVKNKVKYNEYMRYILEHAFKYSLKGKELTFKEDYFIFDFEQYSNLYHYFERDACEKAFMEVLLTYSYHAQKIQKLQEDFSNKHKKIVSFLGFFYEEMLKREDIPDEVRTAMKIYVMRLNGVTNSEVLKNLGILPEEGKKNDYKASRFLKKLSKYLTKKEFPYIEPLKIVYNSQNQKEFCEDENKILEELCTQLKKCTNQEALEIINQKNPCAS